MQSRHLPCSFLWLHLLFSLFICPAPEHKIWAYLTRFFVSADSCKRLGNCHDYSGAFCLSVFFLHWSRYLHWVLSLKTIHNCRGPKDFISSSSTRLRNFLEEITSCEQKPHGPAQSLRSCCSSDFSSHRGHDALSYYTTKSHRDEQSLSSCRLLSWALISSAIYLWHSESFVAEASPSPLAHRRACETV